jgi:hypothetical protein
MIPDDTTIFNSSFVPKHFDDHEARLQSWLGQDAVSTDGGRHLLYACPICKRPWYKAGKSEYPRITSEQLVNLGEALHADTSVLCAFPQALCSICSVIHLGGTFSVEAYRPNSQPYRWGYHLTWEEASFPQSHLIGMICRKEQLTPGELILLRPDILATPVRNARAVFAWMETLPMPDAIFRYTDEESRHLCQRIPPRPGPEDMRRIWRGYSWIEKCPPLHGEVIISLAIALHPQATYSFSGLLASWKVLARMLRVIF